MASAVGRDGELEQIASFLDLDGSARVMLLEGEAGIGKTTIWEQATAAAQPAWRVLRARPREAEARISFAAIGDLLAIALDEVRSDLPPPQLRALEIALLLAEPGTVAPDPQAIAFACLSTIRLLSRSSPVLVAVDDAQWLDRPSAAVLLYAAWRVDDDPVRFLVTQRTEPDGPTADLERTVGPERATRMLTRTAPETGTRRSPFPISEAASSSQSGSNGDGAALGQNDGAAEPARSPMHTHSVPAHSHGIGTLAVGVGGGGGIVQGSFTPVLRCFSMTNPSSCNTGAFGSENVNTLNGFSSGSFAPNATVSGGQHSASAAASATRPASMATSR